MVVGGTFICAIGAAAIALIPDGAWVPFAVLRFFVGFGLGASFAPATTMVVELTPTRHRTVVSSLFVLSASVGGFLASATVAVLLGLIGWRGIAALGAVPVLVGIGALMVVPESARWLTAKGRFEEARAAVAELLHLPLSEVPLPAATPVAPPRASLAELYARPVLFWMTLLAWGGAATAAYGMSLWGPTIIAQLMHISVKQAAHFFVYVSAAGILGKIVFSFAAPLFGGVLAKSTVSAPFSPWPPRPISIRCCSAAYRSLSSPWRSPTSSMQVASRTSPRTRRKPMACAWGRGPPASAREPTAPARSSDR